MIDPEKIKPWNEHHFPFTPKKWLSPEAQRARTARENHEYRESLNRPQAYWSCSLRGVLYTILVPVALLAIVLLHQLLAGSLAAALALLLLCRVTPRLGAYTVPRAWGTALAAMVLPAVTFVLLGLLIAAIAPESFLGRSTIRTVDWLGTSSRMVSASGGWEVDATLGPFTTFDAVLAFVLAFPGVAIVGWWMRRFATRESREPLNWLPTLLVVMLLTVIGWVVLDRVGGFTVSMM